VEEVKAIGICGLRLSAGTSSDDLQLPVDHEIEGQEHLSRTDVNNDVCYRSAGFSNPSSTALFSNRPHMQLTLRCPCLAV